MEREILEAGRRLADYLRNNQRACLGKRELVQLGSVATDLLSGAPMEMVRRMMALGIRSGVYEKMVTGTDPMEIRVATCMDVLVNREMIAESFARRVIGLILVVLHPSDGEVAMVEKFVDGMPKGGPEATVQPQNVQPTPQPQQVLQPNYQPQRIRNIPTPPVQPTVQQRVQNTPTPRPKPQPRPQPQPQPRPQPNYNNVQVNTNIGGTVTVNGVTVPINGGGNISINAGNNNTVVSVNGNNIVVSNNNGNVTVTGGGPQPNAPIFDIRGGVLVKYNGKDVFPTVPSGVTKIGEYAFASNPYITTVRLPQGVTEIGAYAFSDCKKLEMVLEPSSLSVVREYAFSGCTALKGRLVLNGNLREICSYAYNGCRTLAELVVNDGATRIHPYAFSGCKGLTCVIIKSSTVSIGAFAFCGCKSAHVFVDPKTTPSLEPMWDSGVSDVTYK